MRPIPEKFLVYTFTLYNKFRDPDTGKVSYFRTVLSKVFQASKEVAMEQAGKTGPLIQYTVKLLIDSRASIATGLDETGQTITKTYLPAVEWAATPDKAPYFTIQNQDYVVEGDCPVIIPPDTEKDITSRTHLKIDSFRPVHDMDGSIHHWECNLV